MNSIAALVLIMIAAGALGGFTNFLLTTSTDERVVLGGRVAAPVPLRWWGYILIGVVASFIVPLFLSLVQSDLLANIISSDKLDPYRVFLFIGFCLVAAISSRAFIQTISDRVLALARQASQSAQQAKNDTDELAEVVASESETVEPTVELSLAEATAQQPSLSSDESRILQAVQAKPYKRRTLNGIANDSGIHFLRTREILGRLKMKGLVRDIPSKKTNNLLYEITSEGAYALRANGSQLTDARRS